MARQRGVATLVVSVGVALLMAVAAVGMMRSGLLEQKIAANDIRARELQEVAQAGLEYVMASSAIPVELCPVDMSLSDNKYQDFLGNLAVSATQTSLENYEVMIRWCYQRLLNGQKFYFSRSEASSLSASGKYFVEGWFSRNSILNSDVAFLSPFLVNGNFCNSTFNNEKCTGNSSITTSAGVPGVVATGGVNVEKFGNPSFVENSNILSQSGATDAWSYVFGISLESAKNMALENPGRPFYFFANGENISPPSSEESPIVLIMDSIDKNNCPKINNIDIYGVIYLKNACREMNGWGNAKIYGSIVSDGDIYKVTANIEYYKFTANGWSSLNSLTGFGGFLLPGTWKDF